ncbi:MAG: AAA family ATPase [bacterium]|nr:AAA family ATPase [bacterium]
MRRFTSYGPVNTKLHYYAPREALINMAYSRLVGETPSEGGHYITVWAPRQCGKTWTMQQILLRLQKENKFHVLKINLEHLKYENNTAKIINTISKEIGEGLNRDFSSVESQAQFQEIFKKTNLTKPLILILDEFDALSGEGIGTIVSAFRNIYIKRADESNKSTEKKSYLLHGVALIGVRSVLGIENTKGSPFNIQQSLHVPNLTYEEVKGMFQWYSEDCKQPIEPDVVKALYDEARGQPGLTGWFGELITDKFNPDKDKSIGIDIFEEAYAAATHVLPNNSILNIISKANKAPYQETVLDLFKTGEKIVFNYDDPGINYLYMNGVIDEEKVGRTNYYVRFSSPFVQKRLFNYFSRTLFKQLGQLVKPFTDLSAIITATHLDVRELMKLCQVYLDTNGTWLFKDVPRRNDLRVYEAVFHFNLYSYLHSFLRDKEALVFPEFPTGNGKIDLLIKHNNSTYGIELKSYTDHTGYRLALEQAARYGKQLGLSEIFLVIFVESINDQNRQTYETVYHDKTTQVAINPIFITTG